MVYQSLGERLVARDVLTSTQLAQIEALQQAEGMEFILAALQDKTVDKTRLMEAIGALEAVPYVDLARCQLEPECLQRLTEAQARHFKALVLRVPEDGGLEVGLCDPANRENRETLEQILQQPFTPQLIAPDDFNRVVGRLYQSQESLDQLMQQVVGQSVPRQDQAEDAVSVSESAVAQLIDQVLVQAVKSGASDIHFEPNAKGFHIRQRIDGVMHQMEHTDVAIGDALVIRIKVMAHMNIAQTRLPQDGHIRFAQSEKAVDIRVATLPTPDGEQVVMRILDQSTQRLSLQALEMPESITQQIESVVKRPYGLFLVTGPTGSGKTTTLYSMISTLNTTALKVITAEDPIEYVMPAVTQIQVNDAIGLDFSAILRASLRNDPDVLLVGETRDENTTQQALRAAMTGHLVFTTVHVNHAIDAVGRLHDLQADLFTLGSSLIGVLNQRLLRRLCPSCSTEGPASALEQAWLAEHAISLPQAHLAQPGGCLLCHHTGYAGRQLVCELYLPCSSALLAMMANDMTEFHAIATKAMQGRRLIDVAMEQVAQKNTSLAEVMRVIGAG